MPRPLGFTSRRRKPADGCRKGRPWRKVRNADRRKTQLRQQRSGALYTINPSHASIKIAGARFAAGCRDPLAAAPKSLIADSHGPITVISCPLSLVAGPRLPASLLIFLRAKYS